MTTSTVPSQKDEFNSLILNYLKKMGYKHAEHALKEEAHLEGLETLVFESSNEKDASVAGYLLFGPSSFGLAGENSSLSSPFSCYELSFDRLRRWIHESLDIYRDELLQILYPIFVHSFLDLLSKGHAVDAHRFLELNRGEFQAIYGDELNRIAILGKSSETGEKMNLAQLQMQIRENSVALAFRTNKYNVSISAQAFYLLMNFLQEGVGGGGSMGQAAMLEDEPMRGDQQALLPLQMGNLLILKILNQFVNIRVLLSRSPGSISSNAVVSGISGVPAQAIASVNREPVYWGVQAIPPALDEIFNSTLSLAQSRKQQQYASYPSPQQPSSAGPAAPGQPATSPVPPFRPEGYSGRPIVDQLQNSVANLKRMLGASAQNAPPADRVPVPAW